MALASMSNQTVYNLTKYAQKGAASRVRCRNLVPYLRDKGWDVVEIPLLSDRVLDEFYARKGHDFRALVESYMIYVAKLLSARSSALWWIEKEVLCGFPAWLEYLLLPNLSRVVFDYDDAVFLNYRDGLFGPLGRQWKFRRYAQRAGYITVGSRYLREKMTEFGAVRICDIPSTVQVQSYSRHVHSGLGVITIGWIGTPVTVTYLEGMKGVLSLLAQSAEIRVHVVGAQWSCPGVEVVCLPWSEDSESKLVSEFDIGIMPLADDEWERAKCGYKLIQYMAAGVVPVGSRIGENKIIIEEGVTGFLASLPEEWVGTLERLCRDEQLRSRIGARAREVALGKYDVKCAANAVHEVFCTVLTSEAGKNQR